MTLVNLANLTVGSERKIVSLQGDPILVSRLRELGFIRGESIRVVGRAPFGDPLVVEVGGATIALRKEEAECVRL